MPKRRPSVYVEGNNGGDYFYIKHIGKNKVYLEIGNCCLVTYSHELPIELITSALTQLTFGDHKVEGLIEKSGWRDEFLEKLKKQIKYFDFWNRPNKVYP